MAPKANALLTPEQAEAFAELADAHAVTPQALLKRLNVDPQHGLSDERVAEAVARYGRNELKEGEKTPMWVLIARQFQDTLVIILIIAALISFVLAFFEEGQDQWTAFVEPLVIVLILVANATVGVLQESSAEDAVEELKRFQTVTAATRRNGRVVALPAEDLVPGDIVELEAGVSVPADIRLIEIRSSTLDVAEALLTGESTNVGKNVNTLPSVNVQLQDKRNMLFAGTNITRGKGVGVVVATGGATEKGKICDALSEEKEEDFPLKIQLNELGDQLSKAVGVICLVVWAVNIGHFSDPAFGSYLRGAVYYFKISVSLAVAAVPEGLPAVVTTCLALGTQRMAAKNAIVTSLPAVETLGCTNVICSDKTGTLTTNQMSVQRFFVLGSTTSLAEFSVEGSTYATAKADASPFAITAMGHALDLGDGDLLGPIQNYPSLIEAAKVCSLCNESSISWNEELGAFECVGQPTEGSMRVLVEKLGVPDESVQMNLASLNNSDRAMACNNYWSSMYKTTNILEFNRDRKSMSVLATGPDNRQTLYVKGAWDSVLARCTQANVNGKIVKMSAALRKRLSEKITEYCEGSEAYRCLALATLIEPPFTSEDVEHADPSTFAEFESNLTFVGLTGILDPPRAEVRGAVEKCHLAGIRVVVITGDNKKTAAAICRKIGVFGEDEDIEGMAFTGTEFKAMSQEEKIACVVHARLFARVEPLDKKELVDCFHKHGLVVAMTGDGVNDAPALKLADIGLAMGSGTSVAKGAADMILADDNFTTIVAAVEEGRNIYNNTKQFIRYLISSNIGEVVAIFITAITGLPEVLLPVQLLFTNLVTDGLPAIALGFNPSEDGIMLRPPRAKNASIINRFTFTRYMLTGTYVGVATVLGMVWWFTMYEDGPMVEYHQLFGWARCDASSPVDCGIFHDPSPNTMSLSVLVTIEMFCAFNSISETNSLFSSSAHPFTNPKLVAAVLLSFATHMLILYVPFFATIFSVTPLTWTEWQAVLALSAPVIVLDEILKFVDRMKIRSETAQYRAEHKDD
mmetsp:Transcript_8809/g.22167  ORF Transcript_8809/g.22167 Transcript_8809/m.22167 type:complete len:1032 (+) Transcript_8809:181-3276(+)|eukprot:CAMPEP_0174237640 /NCGR_PEP_ID=MMETSP0417-20130205/8889_1 /TAXON_ID=242541 /ORGANISM="Mayorella sp, Strain BSH-02190019" /LENGTH=1031 /DNA_ID=CAMNT_0015316419 /DNA_START=115 /DNA_END=3210 /DNA_ORIENTATION=+